LFKNSNLSIKRDSITIETFPEMTKRGKPKRFGRPNKRLDEKGFSDHFPISLTILSK
jgi:hypothetical protein